MNHDIIIVKLAWSLLVDEQSNEDRISEILVQYLRFTIFPIDVVPSFYTLSLYFRYESLVGTIGKKFTKKRKKQMNAEDYEDEEAVDTEKKEKVEKKKKKFVTPEGANNEVDEQPATVTKKEKLKKKKKVFLKPQEDD